MRASTLRAFGALVTVAALLSGCDGGSGNSDRSLFVVSGAQSQEIGPSGGSFAYQGNPLKGTVFQFPVNAVTSPTTFTITPTTAPNGPWTVVGPAVRLEPANTTFGQPITVTLLFDPSLVPAGQQGDLTVFVVDGQGGITSLGTVAISGNTVIVPSTVTGLFFTALLARPDAALSTIVANPTTNLLADGNASSTITVTLRDFLGNALAGRPVTLTVSGTGNTLSPLGVASSDSNGVTTFTLKSGVAETKTITAVAGAANVQLSSSPTVTFVATGPTALSYSTIPTTITAGAPFSVGVSIVDGAGNTLSGASALITIGATGPGVLGGTTSATAVNGVATFNNLTITTTGSYVFQAVSGSLLNANAGPIPVVAASAVSLVTSGFPSPRTAGVAGNVTVTARDIFNNVATGYAGVVHFTTNASSGAALPADSALTNGTGTFPVTFNLAGSGFTITATDTVNASLTSTQSGIQILPAATADLAFTAPLASPATAGVSGAITVAAVDAFGNVTPGYSGIVHFTTTAVGAALPPDTTLTSGQGTFFITFTQTATNVSVTATDTAQAALSATQTGIVVNPAAASRLTVTGFPTVQTAGVAGNLTVTAFDAFNNVATGFAGPVHFTTTNGTAVLGDSNDPTLPADQTLVNGTRSYTGVILREAGTGFTITASDNTVGSTVIAGVQSGIQIDAAAAATFTVGGFTQTIVGQPGSITVTAFDAFANVATAYPGTVTFSTNNGTAVLGDGNDPTLPTNSTLTNGTGTFNGVILRESGSGFFIRATDTLNGALTGAQTGIAVGAGSTDHFSVTGFPSPRTAGVAGNFTVTALDAFNNVAVGYAGSVQFSTDNGLPPGGLDDPSLPAPSTLTNGVGTFPATLRQASAPGTFSITATDTVTSSITGSQAGIQIDPDVAVDLVITSGFPSPQVAGVAGSMTVQAIDQFGNVATGYTGLVQFTTDNGLPITGDANDPVFPAPSTLTNGVRTFTTIELRQAGVGYTITVTDTVNAALSDAQTGIQIDHAPAASFAFTTPFPSPQSADSAAAFEITAFDAFGNVATTYGGTVHFTTDNGAIATLPADTMLTNGVSVGLTAQLKVASPPLYFLRAQDTANASVFGQQDNISITPGVATHLDFNPLFPATIQAGTPGDFTVRALDQFNNVATGYTGSVVFSSPDQTGTGVQTPTFPTTTTLTAGTAALQATFRKAEGPVSLTAADTLGAITAFTQNGITVTPGNLASFGVTAGTTQTAGAAFDVTVTALDAFTNTVTGYTGQVAFSTTNGSPIGPDANDPTLPANSPLTNGTFTFTGGVTLREATTSTIIVNDVVQTAITGTSAPITVNAAATSQLAVTGFPTPQTAGTPANFTVTALDPFGNLTTGYAGSVTFSTNNGSTNPFNAPSLPVTSLVPGGQASFSATLKQAGTGFTITATDTVTPSIAGTQSGIAITGGAASQLLLSTASSTVVAGTPFNLTVTATDAFGNTDTGYLQQLGLASDDPQVAIFSPASPYTYVSGDAGSKTFSVTLKTTPSRTVTVTDDSSPTPLTSFTTFTVNPGAIADFLVTAPANATAGVANDFSVTARDAFGNTVTGFTGLVNFTSTDPFPATFSPSSFTFAGTENGTQTFTGGVTLKTAGTFEVRATDTAAHTGFANVVVAAAAQQDFEVTTSPSTLTAGSSANLTVRARDAFNNTITAYTGSVNLAAPGDPLATFTTNPIVFVAGDLGVRTVTNGVTLRTSGTQAVNANDGTFSGTTNVVVNPGSAVTLTVVPTPSTLTAGGALTNLVVTARDQFGNVDPLYVGTVHLTCTGNFANLPADHTFTLGNAGVFDFGPGLVLRTAPSQTITATDTVVSLITGNANVTVNPGPLDNFLVDAPPFATSGFNFSVTVTARDQFSNTVTGYLGTIGFSSTNDPAPPANIFNPVIYTYVAGDNGSHVFSNVTLFKAGTAQNITVTDQDDNSKTGADTVNVSAGPVTQLVLTGISDPITAGTASNFRIEARDAAGNVNPTYTATVVFSSDDPFAILPSSYTFTLGDMGAHDFTALSGGQVTFKTRGPNPFTRFLRAEEQNNAAVFGSQTVTVDPGPPQFVITGLPGSAQAGSSNDFTVTVQDTDGNVITGYDGTVTFTKTDLQGAVPADYTFTAGDLGVHLFTGAGNNASFGTAGTQSITLSESVAGSTATPTADTRFVIVTPGPADHFDVTGLADNQPAGTSQTFTVTARDTFGNVATGYAGTVNVTSPNGAASINPASFDFTGQMGVHTFVNGIQFQVTGLQRAVATDSVTASITGFQEVTVTPAALDHFEVTGPVDASAGTSQTLTVRAVDTLGNTASTYAGTAIFTSNDPLVAAQLPDYTFTTSGGSPDNGIHTFNFEFRTAGLGRTVTATDTVQTGVTGTSPPVDITPGAATTYTLSSLNDPSPNNTPQNLTVTARDAFANIATGYLGTVHFTSNDSNAVLPADYTFTGGDAGVRVFSVNLRTGGQRNVTVTDINNASITATTNTVTVFSGAVTNFLVTAAPSTITAGDTTTVTVVARDQFNVPVTDYTGTVTFVSSDPQAVLPANYTFTTGLGQDNGSHDFSVTLKTSGGRFVSVEEVAQPIVNGNTLVMVNAGTATKLVVTTASPATAGAAQLVTVTAADAFDNADATYTGTIQFASTDSNATLPADYTFQAADLGVKPFPGGVTFRTAGARNISVTDGTFNANQNVVVNPGPPAAIAFLTSATNTAPSVAMSPAITLELRDAFGNRATNADDDISLVLGTNPGSGTLTGGNAKNTNGTGRVTFDALSVDNVANGYSLQAISNTVGLTGPFVSNAFNISGAGVAAKLVFTVQGDVYTVNKAMRPPVVMLEIQDTLGGLVTSGGFPSINVALQGGTVGATLSGQQSLGFNNGIGAFQTLSVDTVGTGYTLVATSPGLNPATSKPFSIVTTPNWPQVSNGGFVGGGIDVLAFENASSTLYAGTKCGVWKSVNGADWTDITNGLKDSGFSKIAVDNNSTATPKPVYLSSFNGNLYKSSDAGASWTQLNTNFGGNFALDPTVADKLYVATGQLLVSTNGGANFSPAGGNLNFFAFRLTVAANGDIYASTFGNQPLRISTDGGANFTNISGSGIPNLQNKFIDSIEIAGSTILVTTEEDGFFRSTDGGTTWTTQNIGGHDSAYAIAVDPTNPLTVYVSTYDSEEAPGSRGFWRSTDGGVNFTDIAAGLPIFGTEVTSAVFEPSGQLHVGLFGPGCFKTADPTIAAPVWVSNRAGMPNPDVTSIGIDPVVDAVYATADRRLFKTTNGGGTWTLAATIPSNVKFLGGVVADGAGNVYVGSDLNIIKSDDDGATWTIQSNGIPAGVNAFLPAIDGNNNQVLYVGQFAFNGAIYKTVDGAQTWTTLSTGIANSIVLQIVVDKSSTQVGGRSQTLYALVADNNDNHFVLKSTNEGATWFDTLHPSAVAEFGNSLALDPSGTLYYANIDNGMWVLPGGVPNTWQAINNGLPRNSAALSVSYADATATIFATIQHNEDSGTFVGGPYGVWKSTDGGLSWAPDTHGIYCSEGDGLVFVDPKTPTTVWFAENGLGVHKTMLGTPFKLAFGVQPSDAPPATNMTPSPVVLVQDQGGNTVTGFAGQVSLALGNNPTGSVMQASPQGAAGGSAMFNDVQVGLTGSGYTIVASAPGLASAESQPFTIFGPAAKVAFITQPRDTRVNIVMAPDVRVAIQDASGNTITSGLDSMLPVTLSFAAAPGGAMFNDPNPQATLTVTALNGVATFASAFYNVTGTGYVLQAQDQGATLTAALATAFNVFGNADHLRFAQTPQSTTAGFVIPVVQVRVEDIDNNLVADSTIPISVAITTGPGPLNGTAGPINAVNGVASFTNLSINTSAFPYVLTASTTAPGVGSAPSGSFAIFPGAANQLSFSGQPALSEASGKLQGSPIIRVDVRDSLGNLCVVDSVPIYMSLAPVTNGATLAGTTVRGTTSGQATFTNLLSIATPGNYQIVASLRPPIAFQFNSPDLNLGSAAISQSFTVTAGATATKLAFIAQPTNAKVSTAIPQFQVAFVDAAGNVVTTQNGTINLQFGRGSGGLSGNSQATTLGVATFAATSINTTGTFTLVATTPGFPPVQSQVFVVSNGGTAARLEFLQQPLDATAGNGFGAPVSVRVVDVDGTLVTSGSFQVQLAIPGNFNGQPGQSTNNGVATFSGLQLTTAGTGLTIRASAGGLTSVTSAPFAITANTSQRQLTFKRAAGTPAAGYLEPTFPGQTLRPAFSVAWTDNFGNVITSDANNITVQFAFFTSAQLNGTTTRTPVGGVATFDDLSINQAGSYRLRAIGNSGGQVTSQFQYPTFSSLLIGNVGGTQQLAFLNPPLSLLGSVNTPLSPVQIAIQDAFGNTVPNASASITASIGTPSNGALLTGGTTQNTAGGIATFSNLQVDKSSFYGLNANTQTGLFTNNNVSLEISGFKAVNSGMDGGTLPSLAADPQNTGVVYATTPQNGLWKSTNGGNNWSIVGLASFGNPPEGVLPSLNLLQPFVMVDLQSRVYVSSGSPAGNSLAAPQIFKSTDNGQTWFAAGSIGQGLVTPEGNSPRITTMTYDLQTPATIYAAGDMFSNGLSLPVVFKSTDGGATWADISASLQLATGVTQDGVISIAAASGNLLVGTNNHAVVRSSDGGQTWSQKTLPGGATQARAVVMADNLGNRAYAASLNFNPSGHVYVTTDGGDNWSLYGGTALAQPVQSLAIDPSVANGLFAGTQSGNVFRTDGVLPWSDVSTGLPAAGSFVGVQSLTVDFDGTTVYGAVTNDSFGFGGVGLGAFRFNGTSWTGASTGLRAVRIRSVSVDPSDSQKVVAGGDRVYSSTNGGQTWTLASGLPFSSVNAVAFDPTPPGFPFSRRIFVALNTFNSAAVYVSTDGGISFNPAASLAGGHTNAFGFAFDTSPLPSNPAIVIVATDRGVLGSSTSGASWVVPANTGIPTGNYPSITFDQPNNTLYLGANNSSGQSGVYRSTNGGVSWTAINNGIGNANVVALALDGASKMFMADQSGQGSFGGLFVSNDVNGVTPSWAQQFLSNFNGGLRTVVKDPTTTGATAVLYLGAGAAAKSKDGGSTSNGLLGLTAVNTFAIFPTSTQTVYAGTFGGVYVTSTGGE